MFDSFKYKYSVQNVSFLLQPACTGYRKDGVICTKLNSRIMETETFFFFFETELPQFDMLPTTYAAPVGPTEWNIYTNMIRTIDDINKSFCGIAVIPANSLQRVFASFDHRVQ
jgi:hypothetical protein